VCVLIGFMNCWSSVTKLGIISRTSIVNDVVAE
jgi:hypothetical protein